MGEEEAPQALQPRINGEQKPPEINAKSKLQYKWWIEVFIYAFLVIAGQAAGTILGRLYFNYGGKSVWMATLGQVAGFPVLFPIQWLVILRKTDGYRSKPDSDPDPDPPACSVLAALYVCLGVFVAADCLLYSIGLQYLPVSTYTLICSSQLAFNALFSYFLNRQKMTPYIINSLVILTISSVLLVFQHDSGDSNPSSSKKYTIGFICTLGGSAGYALTLSLTQLAFTRIIKKETLRSVMDMTVYQSIVASIVVVVCFLATGDWKRTKGEILGFDLGKTAYVLVLVWTGISWQVFGIGCIGLIFKVSSLFSNVISVVGLPVAPVLAVVFLHDKLTGLKAVAMVMAVWGFVSYMYQQYIDLEGKKMEKSRGFDEREIGLVRENG